MTRSKTRYECYLLSAVLQPYSRCSCLALAGDPALLHYALFLRRGDSGTHTHTEEKYTTLRLIQLSENKNSKYLLKIPLI